MRIIASVSSAGVGQYGRPAAKNSYYSRQQGLIYIPSLLSASLLVVAPDLSDPTVIGLELSTVVPPSQLQTVELAVVGTAIVTPVGRFDILPCSPGLR